MENTTPTRKRGLGRGLGALILNTGNPLLSPVPSPSGVPQDGVHQIPLSQIEPNPRQPRTHFDEEALAELAASVQIHGIIQPLIVTQHPEHPDRYYLVTGERRWRAARLAGLDQAPALIREASPSQLIEWALIENLQRADLNPLEEATAYQELIDEFGLTQDEVAERVGKSRPTVANAIRLLKLPHAVQEAISTQKISAGHARTLLSLKEVALIERVCAEVIQKSLNVRQTEALVNRLLATPSPDLPTEEPPWQPYLANLENQFRSVLGTRVNLSRNANGSGRLVIHFFNEDDLANLYRLIVKDDNPGE
jgi:ParB family chromosome partitioning protein